MDYEYLIRRAHQVGRYGVAGADADSFRELERTYALYKNKLTSRPSSKPVEEIHANYFLNLGKISAYIKTAIQRVMQKEEKKLSDAQYNELEECLIDLRNPDMNGIFSVMQKADRIMLEIGLYPQ